MVNLGSLIICTLLVFAAGTAVAECTCDPDQDLQKDPKVGRYKVAALFAILVAGGVGVAAPLIGRRVLALSPEGDIYFAIKACAAGVILATGFIHILLDTFQMLSSSCLEGAAWQDFPFAGFIVTLI